VFCDFWADEVHALWLNTQLPAQRISHLAPVPHAWQCGFQHPPCKCGYPQSAQDSSIHQKPCQNPLNSVATFKNDTYLRTRRCHDRTEKVFAIDLSSPCSRPSRFNGGRESPVEVMEPCRQQPLSRLWGWAVWAQNNRKLLNISEREMVCVDDEASPHFKRTQVRTQCFLPLLSSFCGVVCCLAGSRVLNGCST